MSKADLIMLGAAIILNSISIIILSQRIQKIERKIK